MSRRLRRAGFPRRKSLGLLALALVAVAAAVLGALQLTGTFSRTAPRAAPRVVRPSVPSHPAARRVPPPLTAAAAAAAAARSAAAAWVASQVDSAAIIGCDPATCAALEAQAVSASRLVALGPATDGVPRTDVIATLSSADKTLVDHYAPALIASFGSGSSRIEIRAVAPGGAASYQSALRADLNARESAGTQLLRNPRIRFSAADAAQLRAGQVDSRLLATLAALSSQFTLQVTAFGDSSPGAPLLFREVTIASTSAARLAAALAMVKAQGGPYLPAHSVIVHLDTGQPALTIEFAAPGPVGLLTTVLTADVR